MLIIGDLASKAHGENSVLCTPEIIYKDKEERDEIVKRYSLGSNPVYKKAGVEYFKHNGNIIRLFDGDFILPFKKALEYHPHNSNEIKLASFIFNYCFYKAKIRFRNYNYHEWQSDVIRYNYYRKEAKKRASLAFKTEFKNIYNSLVQYSVIHKNTNVVSYEYNKALVYDERTIYDLFNYEDASLYVNLIHEDNVAEKYLKTTLLKSKWDKYSEDEKHEAAMQKLYVDSCKEYIIPYYSTKYSIPADCYEYFILSIMNLCTSMYYPKWFKEYIIANYEKLTFDYNQEYIAILMMAMDYNGIEKLEN